MTKQRGVTTLDWFPRDTTNTNEHQQIEKEDTERDTRMGKLLEIRTQTTQLIQKSQYVW